MPDRQIKAENSICEHDDLDDWNEDDDFGGDDDEEIHALYVEAFAVAGMNRCSDVHLVRQAMDMDCDEADSVDNEPTSAEPESAGGPFDILRKLL
jgi:hypothetical protein